MFGLLVAVFLAVALGSSSPRLLRDSIREADSPIAHTLLHFLENPIETIKSFFSELTFLSLVTWPLVIYCAVFTFQVFFKPLHVVRKAGDMGYILDDARSKMEVVNEMRKRRRPGNLPPVYPNGWFSVGRSIDLKKGDVWYKSMLGLELAIYRGEDGQARILHAYCPHMGANIAVGGRVKGNCLECPFHGWAFEGKTGEVKVIPYASKIPPSAKTKHYTCLELNGIIHMWYHADDESPSWYPPDVKDIQSGRMTFHGKTDHIVNSHIEEIPENGADLHHLNHLHEPILFSGRDLRHTTAGLWQYMTHLWDGEWHQDPENSHIGILNLETKVAVFGKAFPGIVIKAKAEQVGPGLVFLHIFLPIVGEVLLVQTVTPLEPLLQDVQHTAFGVPSVPRIVAKFALWAESVQFERDLMVWNHKTYEAKPLLTKEDHLVGKHRRWYSQFYSENSPRFQFKNNDGMDW